MLDLQSDEEWRKLQKQTNNTHQITVEMINISNQEPEVSRLSDNDSRMSFLQNQINAITSNFTVALEQLCTQASNQEMHQKVMFEQQQELSNLIKGIIMQNKLWCL
jgi:hypothetical protein